MIDRDRGDEKDKSRSRRKKRRSQLAREKGVRSELKAKEARAELKAKDSKRQLDLRIGKLIDQGYSVESVAKRLGVTPRRIHGAIEANRRI
jgi:hypothetical protein